MVHVENKGLMEWLASSYCTCSLLFIYLSLLPSILPSLPRSMEVVVNTVQMSYLLRTLVNSPKNYPRHIWQTDCALWFLLWFLLLLLPQWCGWGIRLLPGLWLDISPLCWCSPLLQLLSWPSETGRRPHPSSHVLGGVTSIVANSPCVWTFCALRCQCCHLLSSSAVCQGRGDSYSCGTKAVQMVQECLCLLLLHYTKGVIYISPPDSWWCWCCPE